MRLRGFDPDGPLELALSGASPLDLGTLRAGDTRVNLSGAAKVAGTVAMTAGDFQLSGASRANLSGWVASVSIDASGGRSLDLGSSKAEKLKAQMSGGSDATVRVTGVLDAELSGGSHLEYYGGPTMGDIQTSGGAEVRRAGD